MLGACSMGGSGVKYHSDILERQIIDADAQWRERKGA